MIKSIYKKVKEFRAIKALRKSLAHFKEIDNVSDSELENWVREHITKLGTHEIVSPHFVPSYVEVKDAAISTGRETEDLFIRVKELSGLSEVECQDILDKCRGDVAKFKNVVQLMLLTYDNDDNVLYNYQSLVSQFRHKLKLL